MYLQVYNLGIGEETHRPDATIEYSINSKGKAILTQEETTEQLEHLGQQITLKKVVPLAGVEPGEYEVSIKVTDRIRQQELSSRAPFRVVP